MAEKLRVVVIGTGNIGGIVCRCIQGREDMELVGVWAHKEAAGHLIGTDAGLLDGYEPCGITITGDEEDIFALAPDCAIMVINVRDPRAAMAVNGEWYAKLLTRGINVVTPSVGDLLWPKGAVSPEFVAAMQAAGEAGGASIYMNGQEPGYAESQAFLLASCSNTIKRLTISEMYNYSTAPVKQELSLPYGFGEPMEYTCMFEDPSMLDMIWGITVRHIANYLGYEIERMESTYEKRTTDHVIPVGWGTIEPGEVAAIRMRTSGYINGREAIVLEHVNRMEQGIEPDWPMTDRVGQIRVTVEGDPNLQADMNVSVPEHPEELSYEGYVLTGMRLMNAIPEVVAAKPGIVTVHDIAMPKPSAVFRSDMTSFAHKVCAVKR